jgi:hypothetical protein
MTNYLNLLNQLAQTARGLRRHASNTLLLHSASVP